MVNRRVRVSISHQLSRKLLPLSIVVGLLISLCAPSIYMILAHNTLQHLTTLSAENMALMLQSLPLEKPEILQYQTDKFKGTIENSRRHLVVTGICILDNKGNHIEGYEYGNCPVTNNSSISLNEEIKSTLGRAAIVTDNRQIGTVELFVSDIYLLQTTIILFCFSSSAGLTLAIVMYRFPTGVVRSLERSIGELSDRVKGSEHMYRLLVDNIPDATWTIDKNGNFDFISNAVERMLGHPIEEISSGGYRFWLDITHPDDREMVRKAFEEVLTHGKDFDVDSRLCTKDGKWIWTHNRGVGRVEIVGESYAIGLISNISERMRSAEEIRKASEFSRTVMDSINDAIYIVDAKNYSILGCNANFLESLGMQESEVLGQSCFEMVHPSNKVLDCPLQETIRTGRQASAEIQVSSKNNERLFIEITTTPIFDYEGKITRVLHVNRDITERKHMEDGLKESEMKFRSLVEESFVGVYIIQDRIFRYVNPKLAAIFGYEVEELLDLKGPEDLVIADDWPMVEESIRRRISGETESLNYEFRGITKQGATISLEVYGSITAYQGQPAIIGTLLDVTVRKLALDALREQTVELIRSNAELEQFAYVASHDLQEPLRMVTSYMRLLSERYSDKVGKDGGEFIAYAVDAAARMQRLISDLLLYSRTGAKGRKFHPVDCNKVFNLAMANLKEIIGESYAEIIVSPLPMVNGDDTQLIQLFQNLLGNAIKFRSEKPVNVDVSAVRQGEGWLFSVRDNGIGIDPQYFEKVFQIFKRLHSRTDYPGTGIGLAVCKKIVESHGGRIWIESVPGSGTTFFFTIPSATFI